MEPDTRKLRDLACPCSNNNNTNHGIYEANIVKVRGMVKKIFFLWPLATKTFVQAKSY